MIARPFSGRIHEVLDYQEVWKVFQPIKKPEELTWEDISSPFDLYSVETLRDHFGLRYVGGVPTDVFVFGKGEGPKREVTKIGGLPYWPSSKPWPKTHHGKPIHFLAQFNFADSKDVTGELPGQLLLVFVEEEEEFYGSGEGEFRLEWMNVGDGPLVQEKDLPKRDCDVDVGKFYGVIHRTADYPNSVEKAYERWEGRGEQVAMIMGTKIGGVPVFIQPTIGVPGRFLCQLASIQPAADVPFPWVNRESSYGVQFDEEGIYGPGNSFGFGDMGSLYIFLQKDGSLLCESQIY